MNSCYFKSQLSLTLIVLNTFKGYFKNSSRNERGLTGLELESFGIYAR